MANVEAPKPNRDDIFYLSEPVLFEDWTHEQIAEKYPEAGHLLLVRDDDSKFWIWGWTTNTEYGPLLSDARKRHPFVKTVQSDRIYVESGPKSLELLLAALPRIIEGPDA